MGSLEGLFLKIDRWRPADTRRYGRRDRGGGGLGGRVVTGGVRGVSTRAGSPAAALIRQRGRLALNHLDGLLSGSRLRLSMILICSTVFWVILFGLFTEGFRFMNSYLNATSEIVEYLFGIFFLSLSAMLVVSTGIILYSSLFNSRESTYLLTLPAGADLAFLVKFAEALGFSSWGFLLLGSPMMVAYGITVDAGWPYYAIFLGYLLGFVLIAGSLGAIGAFLVANYLPRRPKVILAVLGSILVVGAIAIGFRVLGTRGDTLSREWLDSLIANLGFGQNPLWPSRWLSRGLVGTARGEVGTGLFYLGVLTANAAMAYLVAAIVARDLYRRGYSRVQGGRSSRRRRGLYWLDAAFHRAFAPIIPRPIRLLILKDLRSFRRDPAQWSQFLIFFGLLGFYFLNIRRLGYQIDHPYWRNLLSFLNLAVTALILSTFTTRFIFPMLSLEGRNFWVLGLLPLERASIIWGKFAFASGIALVATEGLVVLSDLMLKVNPGMVAVHVAAVAILCLGLSAISVGLGARLPNLREDDPSKIAAGFGGTLNLLVSLVFITLVVGSLAIPSLQYYSAGRVDFESAFVRPIGEFYEKIALAMGFCLAVGAVATIVPIRMGIRAFRDMEF